MQFHSRLGTGLGVSKVEYEYDGRIRRRNKEKANVFNVQPEINRNSIGVPVKPMELQTTASSRNFPGPRCAVCTDLHQELRLVRR